MVRVLPLAPHVLEKQKCAVADARQACAKPTGESALAMFSLNLTFLALPVDSERRVGKEVVEVVRDDDPILDAFVGVPVVEKAVPELNQTCALLPLGLILRRACLHQKVRSSNCICAWVEILSVNEKVGVRVQVPYMALCF